MVGGGALSWCRRPGRPPHGRTAPGPRRADAARSPGPAAGRVARRRRRPARRARRAGHAGRRPDASVRRSSSRSSRHLDDSPGDAGHQRPRVVDRAAQRRRLGLAQRVDPVALEQLGRRAARRSRRPASRCRGRPSRCCAAISSPTEVLPEPIIPSSSTRVPRPVAGHRRSRRSRRSCRRGGTKGGLTTRNRADRPRTSTATSSPSPTERSSRARAMPTLRVGRERPAGHLADRGAVGRRRPPCAIAGSRAPGPPAPTACGAAPASFSASSASRPQKAGFFQPTAQPVRACTGVMSIDRSWPCSG